MKSHVVDNSPFHTDYTLNLNLIKNLINSHASEIKRYTLFIHIVQKQVAYNAVKNVKKCLICVTLYFNIVFQIKSCSIKIVNICRTFVLSMMETGILISMKSIIR